MTEIKKLSITGQDDPETNEFKISIIEVQPAVVIHCADIDKRKFYYIHILEGSPDPPSFVVYDELDELLPGVILVGLHYNNVSKHGRATITYSEGILELAILRTEPWIKNLPTVEQNSNGKNSQSSTMDMSAS